MDSTTVKAAINVFVYSYRNKNLTDYLSKFLETIKNKDLVTVIVFDQNNTGRFDEIEPMSNVLYRHLIWDDHRGPNNYRMAALRHPLKYFFSIDDNILPPYGWDELFPKMVSESRSVISMFGKQIIEPANFGVKISYENFDDYSVSRFAEPGFLFLDRSMSEALLKTTPLKVDGISYVLSKYFFEKSIEIKSLPSSSVVVLDKPEKDYIPYSKKHNYNLAIRYLKSEPVKEFSIFSGMDIQDISEWPHESNDVLYFNPRSSLDRKDNKVRFHSPYNKISFSGRDNEKPFYKI